MISLIGIMFCVTGLQFWMTNYLQFVLGVNKALATSYVAITNISAPICGVVIGGAVLTFYGGHQSKKALTIVEILGWIVIALVLPCPFLENFSILGVLLWILIFIGGWLMPYLTCVMLNSVEGHMRGAANGLSQFG